MYSCCITRITKICQSTQIISKCHTIHYPLITKSSENDQHNEIISNRHYLSNHLQSSSYLSSSNLQHYPKNVSNLHYYPKTRKHMVISHLVLYKNRHRGCIPRVWYSSSPRRYWSIPNVLKFGSRQ